MRVSYIVGGSHIIELIVKQLAAWSKSTQNDGEPSLFPNACKATCHDVVKCLGCLAIEMRRCVVLSRNPSMVFASPIANHAVITVLAFIRQCIRALEQ